MNVGAPTASVLQPVSVIVFPGGFNWPIWMAQEKGYFAKGGIDVALTLTPNSVFQLTNLIDGKFDIAMTAIDNVVAYMEGQGEAQTALKPDLVVFMGGDNGFLSLVGVLDLDGVRRVLALRSEYGHPKKEMNDPTKYLSSMYYREAINSPLTV